MDMSRRDIIAEALRAELRRRSPADPVTECDVPMLARAIEEALTREGTSRRRAFQEGHRPEDLNSANDG